LIFTIIEFLILIATGGIIWYFLDSKTIEYIEYFTSKYPGAFNTQHVAFMKSIWHFFLFFMIIGGMYYIFVWVQRERTPEGYYV